MLTLLTTVFGFLAPFVGPFINGWLETKKRAQENAHELAILNVQMERDKQQHLARMEEIESQADIAEATVIRKEQPSFGVQVLDAAARSGFSQWVVLPVFWAFAVLDWVAGITRPGITWLVVGLYVSVKGTQVWVGVHLADGDPVMMAQAIINVWVEYDQAMLQLVVSYWFGERARKAIFGGSASHSAPTRG